MRTFIVDAFTNVPFSGNPAGVCLVESPLEPDRMLQIAQELNLSETAFLQQARTASTFDIRFFSPRQEILLCGHATLASARVVFDVHGLHEARFRNSEALLLPVRAVGPSIELELPAYATRPAPAPAALLSALGISHLENSVYNEETGILCLEIAETQILAGLDPDFAALHRSHDSINGVVVTARSRAGDHDFHSRYFWPWSGTDEDPVTGATHTFLAGYWSSRLGKTRMRSFQASRRTGSMEVDLCGDKVRLRGEATTVFVGKMRLPARAVDPGDAR